MLLYQICCFQFQLIRHILTSKFCNQLQLLRFHTAPHQSRNVPNFAGVAVGFAVGIFDILPALKDGDSYGAHAETA